MGRQVTKLGDLGLAYVLNLDNISWTFASAMTTLDFTGYGRLKREHFVGCRSPDINDRRHAWLVSGGT